MSTLRVAVLYGGRGHGHELSCRSATAMIQNLARDQYDVLPVRITPEGHWVSEGDDLAKRLPPLESMLRVLRTMSSVDVAFPCLHDQAGAVQSVLRFAGIPHVGSGVTATAAAADPDVARKLLAAEGIPVADDSGGATVSVGVLEYPDGWLTTTAGSGNAATDRLADIAIRTFRALGCTGLLRVGLVARHGADGPVAVAADDLDTMPSLAVDDPFPRMWQTAGLTYPLLLDLLVEAAAGSPVRSVP